MSSSAAGVLKEVCHIAYVLLMVKRGANVSLYQAAPNGSRGLPFGLSTTLYTSSSRYIEPYLPFRING
jgi:hypothetical protein